MKSLPEEIGNISTIERLFLVSNKIETLPRSLTKCLKLHLLDLRDNKPLGDKARQYGSVHTLIKNIEHVQGFIIDNT